MKKLLTILTCATLLLGATPIFTGCQSSRLETGGAYAPIGEGGTQMIAPDITLFVLDASFKFAHQIIRAAFDLEYEHRQLLWNLSPEIKRGMDRLRPEVNEAIKQYGLARDVYLADPTPANLDHVRFYLAKTKQLATAVEAVIPKQ